MGKNGKFGKDYGRVVGGGKAGPGWKGPGYVKKLGAPAKTKTKAEEEANDQPPESVVPVELQQLFLNIFKNGFPEILASDNLQGQLQEVKTALYERDFSRAFGKTDYLEAYSIRWSPSRAMCYASILVDLRKHLATIFPFYAVGHPKTDSQLPVDGPSMGISLTPLNAVCFGGGAAEVVGFGGFLRYLHESKALENEPNSVTDIAAEALTGLSVSKGKTEINLLLMDSAPWQGVVDKLQKGLHTPPPLSKYASLAAKEANSPLLEPGTVATSFCTEDILALSQTRLNEIVGKQPMLVTLLFTLNELYTTSIAKTTAFLLNLTTSAQVGTLLLVVDSPGTYSETTIGTEAKKYPMLWLLNHTLFETQKTRGHESSPNWVKVVSDESLWFRLPDGLRYPITLENMRYQLHLYRRV